MGFRSWLKALAESPAQPTVREASTQAQGQSWGRSTPSSRSLSERSYTAAQRAGFVRGRHYTEHVEDVKRLKREDQLEDALALIYECIDASERQNAIDGYGVPPGWYQNASIVLRKMGDYEADERLLEDVIRRFGWHDMRERLATTKKKLGKPNVGPTS
ncbi:MAG: hypothetical protein ACTJHU_03740 [Mycetocola sp.]